MTTQEACKRFGIEYQTAAQAVRVCKAIESCRRLQDLSFYHHQEVAGRDDKAELLAVTMTTECKAGEMLAAMENAKTGPKKLGDTMSPNSLEDLGITKKQSSRWQKVTR